MMNLFKTAGENPFAKKDDAKKDDAPDAPKDEAGQPGPDDPDNELNNDTAQPGFTQVQLQPDQMAALLGVLYNDGSPAARQWYEDILKTIQLDATAEDIQPNDPRIGQNLPESYSMELNPEDAQELKAIPGVQLPETADSNVNANDPAKDQDPNAAPADKNTQPENPGSTPMGDAAKKQSNLFTADTGPTQYHYRVSHDGTWEDYITPTDAARGYLDHVPSADFGDVANKLEAGQSVESDGVKAEPHDSTEQGVSGRGASKTAASKPAVNDGKCAGCGSKNLCTWANDHTVICEDCGLNHKMSAGDPMFYGNGWGAKPNLTGGPRGVGPYAKTASKTADVNDHGTHYVHRRKVDGDGSGRPIGSSGWVGPMSKDDADREAEAWNADPNFRAKVVERNGDVDEQVAAWQRDADRRRSAKTAAHIWYPLRDGAGYTPDKLGPDYGQVYEKTPFTDEHGDWPNAVTTTDAGILTLDEAKARFGDVEVADGPADFPVTVGAAKTADATLPVEDYFHQPAGAGVEMTQAEWEAHPYHDTYVGIDDPSMAGKPNILSYDPQYGTTLVPVTIVGAADGAVDLGEQPDDPDYRLGWSDGYANADTRPGYENNDMYDRGYESGYFWKMTTGSIHTMASRENDLIAALASGKATAAEEQRMTDELVALRAHRTAAVAAGREVSLVDAVIEERLAPVASFERTSSKTDWVLDLPEHDAANVQREAAAEASMWVGRLHEAVREDAEEFGEQARGWGRRWASKYDMAAPVAYQAFMSHVAHLDPRVGAWDDGQDEDVSTDGGTVVPGPAYYDGVAPVTEEKFDNFVPEQTPDQAAEDSNRVDNVTGAAKTAAEDEDTAQDGQGGSSLTPVEPSNADNNTMFPVVLEPASTPKGDDAADVASTPTPGSSVADYPQPKSASTDAERLAAFRATVARNA